MNRAWTLIGGMTVGASLAYLLGTQRTRVGRRKLHRGSMSKQGHPARRSAKGGTMEASATLTVRAPVERVFEFWNDYQNFPRFMSHVGQVYRSGDKRSHWKVAGPVGMPVEFDTVITECEPNRQIAWKSLRDSPIETSGHVHFEAQSDGSTWVGVCIRYTPPAGPLGRAVVSLFGPNPQRMLEGDLARMAALIEEDEPPKEGREEPIERWEDESPQAREEP